jgi:hypothetical protein
MSLATLGRSPAVSDEQEYRLICAATLPFFLVAVLAQRAWRLGRPRSGAPRSILAEARAANASALLFAFQG